MNVLAIGCHPDDLEIACSGTLRKYVEQGATVYMCHVANGDQGHVIIEPEPLATLRAEEARRAAMFIGAKEIFSIGISDMQVIAMTRHRSTLWRMWCASQSPM